MGNWIRNANVNRSQCVAIENVFYSITSVISGVPQGSVLGPVSLATNDAMRNANPS